MPSLKRIIDDPSGRIKGIALLAILLGLLLSALLLAIYWRQHSAGSVSESSTLTAPAECDLQQNPCSIQFADGSRIGFEIEPRPIPLLKPLTLTATIAGMRAPRVELQLVGVNLDMGRIVSTLDAVDAGKYQGSIRIPLCSKTLMQWRASLTASDETRTLTAIFPFETRYTPVYTILE